jgi:hypothetical protein
LSAASAAGEATPGAIGDRHMKDWKKIASANNLHIPETDFERITPPLDALEKAFRPLVQSIPAQIEPAVVFQISEEETE